MRSEYIKKFDIHQIYKTNDIQKIFIGSPKGKSNEYVIINIVNDKRFLQRKFKEQLKQLHNLVYFEDIEEAVVFVTSINKEANLNEYIKSNTIDMKERLNLAYQYLGKIARYDGFPNDIKNTLVEASQITVKNNNIVFNEALIVEPEDVNKEYDFKKVSQTVADVLNTILFTNATFGDKKVDIGEIVGFVSNLQYNTHKHKNLNSLLNSFQELYYDTLDNIHIDTGKNIGESWARYNNYSHGKRDVNKKLKGHNLKMAISIAAIGVAGTLFVTGIGSRLINNDGEVEESVVYLEEIEIESEDIGVGSDGSVDEGRDDNNASEILKELDISYQTPELIERDENVFRSGQYSIKFKDTEDRLSKSISLDNVNISSEGHYTLSMWIMSDALESINLKFEGYDNSYLVFKHALEHYPRRIGMWEMVNLSVPPKMINGIKIITITSDAVVWIDDIKIDMYK